MSEYDRSIHSNPDAAAWAKFFMETATKHGWLVPGGLDEGTMIGWFANAMMAMHDHLKRALPPDPAPEAAEIARLVDALLVTKNYTKHDPDVCSCEEQARAALLSAIRALAAPGPDRYAEGWRAGVETSARVLEGAHMVGPIHAEVMHASARAVRELADQRALPVPEPAPAGEKEGR